jgi:hypothetical protein
MQEVSSVLTGRKLAAMRNEKEAISTWMGPLAIALDTKLSGPTGRHTKVSHLHPHRLRTLCEQFVIAIRKNMESHDSSNMPPRKGLWIWLASICIASQQSTHAKNHR